MSITRTVGLLFISLLMLASWPSAATVFSLDRFVVARNGAIIFDDEFDAGGPPPSAPNFLSNGNPASYAIAGGATMGPEVGGKLLLNPSQNGVLIPGILGNPTNLVQKATLQTNINPASPNGLKQGNAIAIAAVYDLIAPSVYREAYGIRFEDFGGASGGNDTLELAVRRMQDNSLAVSFRELDFVSDVITNIADYFLTPQDMLNQQIALILQTVGTSSEVQAGFAFGNGGVFGPLAFLSGTGTIFTDENYTRGVIITRAPPLPLPATPWLLFVGLAALAGLRRRA